jgi:outer membrane PBP1 activator LpoA protein
MKRLAIFEDEPQAQQAATMLREQGFQADVLATSTEAYGEAIKRFFRGETHGFNGTTLLSSEDAEEEPFDNAVTKQYGRVITGTV